MAEPDTDKILKTSDQAVGKLLGASPEEVKSVEEQMKNNPAIKAVNGALNFVQHPTGMISHSLERDAKRSEAAGNHFGHFAKDTAASTLRVTEGLGMIAGEAMLTGGISMAAQGVQSPVVGEAVNDLNQPDRVLLNLAKAGYGEGKTVAEKEASLHKEFEEYKKVAKPRAAGGLAGTIGAFAVDMAAGGDVVHHGGRDTDKFAQLKHSGGTVAEFHGLAEAAEKGHGRIDVNSYSDFRKASNHQEHGDANIRAADTHILKTALEHGGNAEDVAKHLARQGVAQKGDDVSDGHKPDAPHGSHPHDQHRGK